MDAQVALGNRHVRNSRIGGKRTGNGHTKLVSLELEERAVVELHLLIGLVIGLEQSQSMRGNAFGRGRGDVDTVDDESCGHSKGIGTRGRQSETPIAWCTSR